MNEKKTICGDNRFEIIEKAKKYLLESTNIQSSADEMKVLDNILFRCWQSGWLDKFDSEKIKLKDKPYTVWHNFKYEKPKNGTEVIAYHHKWINNDFNPNGQRVGFFNDDGFISAFWWDYHGDYIAIDKNKCEGDKEMYSSHLDNIEPEWWTDMPLFNENE